MCDFSPQEVPLIFSEGPTLPYLLYVSQKYIRLFLHLFLHIFMGSIYLSLLKHALYTPHYLCHLLLHNKLSQYWNLQQPSCPISQLLCARNLEVTELCRCVFPPEASVREPLDVLSVMLVGRMLALKG